MASEGSDYYTLSIKFDAITFETPLEASVKVHVHPFIPKMNMILYVNCISIFLKSGSKHLHYFDSGDGLTGICVCQNIKVNTLTHLLNIPQ